METVSLVWLAPEEALEGFEQGTLFLPPPTWIILRELAELPTRAQVRAAAPARDLRPIQPELGTEDGQIVLALPGDPLHPASCAASARHRILIEPSGYRLIRHGGG